MKNILVAFTLLIFSTSAFAGSCPMMAGKVKSKIEQAQKLHDAGVKAHSDGSPITLYFTQMKVNRKGRERVLREKRKNVHAGVEGYLSHEDSHVWHGWVDMVEISYNPYKYPSFYDVETKKSRWYADLCKLYQDKVLVERVVRGIPFFHNPVYNEAENCLTQA